MKNTTTFFLLVLFISLWSFGQDLPEESTRYQTETNNLTKEKQVENIEKKYQAPWLDGSNRGFMLNLTGLGCVDNYPSVGVGAELGLSHINSFGITTSAYLGGANNECLWFGFSAGYTHGLTKIAPYGLLGGSFILSGLDAALAGTLEMGVNFRLTSWLSAKPSLRFSLGKFEGETTLYNNNVLMVSLTLDPFRLLPYWY